MTRLDEYTGVASMASTVHGTHNLASLGRHAKDKGGFQEPKKRKKKKNEDAFADIIAQALLEVVKKKGGVWKLYDDQTKTELGSYKDRKAAWNAQRIKRMQAKSNKAANKKKHKHKQKKVKPAEPFAQKKHKHESFEGLVAQVLLEASPYVFEQSPTSQDSAGWENFIGRMSHEVMQSDPKLKSLLVLLHKTRLKVLQQAHDALAKVLHKTGEFEVGKVKLQKQGDDADPILTFDIKILGANKKAPIGIVIQHDKPVFSIPEQTKALLNSMATKESKLLRAELMHVQETLLDHMNDVTVAAEKRNTYLKNMETKLDKLITSMDPIQIAMLRNLIKTKFKGFK